MGFVMVLPARRSLAFIAAACLLALVLLGAAAMAMAQSLPRSFVASPEICLPLRAAVAMLSGHIGRVLSMRNASRYDRASIGAG
jgi:hypothetical protein